MIETAVIMAAGMGTRFGERTETIPKGFIEVGGESMIIRSLDALIACGIKRIIIGTGYQKEMYEDLSNRYPQLEFCYNEKYDETNSMWTLHLCQELIGDDDFILLESDLIFEKKAIDTLIENENKDIMLVSDVIKFQDSYYVERNSDGHLTNCSVDENDLDVYGELIGIHKLSNGFYKQLCNYYSEIRESNPNMGYEFVLMKLSQSVTPLSVLKAENLKWYEIDDEADLEYAEENVIQYIDSIN